MASASRANAVLLRSGRPATQALSTTTYRGRLRELGALTACRPPKGRPEAITGTAPSLARTVVLREHHHAAFEAAEEFEGELLQLRRAHRLSVGADTVCEGRPL